MPARTSDAKGVRPSVKRVHCDKTEERSVQIYIPYHTKEHLSQFSEKKNGW